MKKVALIGSNISHSLSPAIWNFLSIKKQYPLQYSLCDLPCDITADDFLAAARKFDAVNITAPFKNLAKKVFHYNLPLNFAIMGKTPKAFSLDGIGALRALSYHKIPFEKSSILVLGTGGAAESVIYELTKSSAKVYCVGRNTHRQKELRDKYSLKEKDKYDVIMSFLPRGVDLYFAKVDLKGAKCYFDANYNCDPPLKRLSEDAIFIDGLPMLFFQACASFEILADITLNDMEELYEEFFNANSDNKWP